MEREIRRDDEQELAQSLATFLSQGIFYVKNPNNSASLSAAARAKPTKTRPPFEKSDLQPVTRDGFYDVLWLHSRTGLAISVSTVRRAGSYRNGAMRKVQSGLTRTRA